MPLCIFLPSTYALIFVYLCFPFSETEDKTPFTCASLPLRGIALFISPLLYIFLPFRLAYPYAYASLRKRAKG